jgi:nucleoid-associated protein YgaU
MPQEKTPPKSPADFSNVKSGSSTHPLPSEQSQDQWYTVVTGDSLSKISKHFYGDGNRWQKIFDANRDQIQDPDLIRPGQRLKIPAATKSA